MNARIITLCVAGFPGTDRALLEAARTCGLSRHLTLSVEGPGDPAVIFLADYIRSQRPDWLIFGGWSNLYEVFLTALAATPIRFGVYWTSSPGQVEISGESDTLAGVLEDHRISARLVAARTLADSLQQDFAGVHHLPATLQEQPQVSSTAAPVTRISLFCSPSEYRRKNVLNCLLALSQVRQAYRLHVNGLSTHRLYRLLLERLRIPYVDHGWMPFETCQQVVGEVDLGLQVSFSESFNYVTADHLMRGIAVVGSSAVPVLQDLSRPVRRALVVDAPDSPECLAAVLGCLLSNPADRLALGRRASQEFRRHNRRNIRLARQTLMRLLAQP